MFNTMFYFLIVLKLLASSFSKEADQFDYDAQILDKMIRMELKVEEMDKEMREIQSNAIYLPEKVSRVLDNKTEELLLLESRVDLLMIAFSAYNPIDLSLDTNQILILQTVPLNEGGGYDNVLGTFTAPVTGLYLFTAHVCNYSGRGVYYDIVLEYITIARSTQYNTAQHDCSSVSAITMVTADQRVWVKCTSGSSSSNQLYEDSHRQTSFAGVLLQR